MRKTLVGGFIAAAVLLHAQTVINGSRSILGIWDAGDASATIPAKVGTTLPGTCSIGEQFFKSDATAGANIYLCTAANTWTQVAAGGGGGGERICTPGDLRYVCVVEEFVGAGTASNQIGTLGWGLAGGTAAVRAGIWPNLGIVRIATASTSGSTAAVRLAVQPAHPFENIANDTTRLAEAKFVFRLSHTADIQFRVALGDDQSIGAVIYRGIGLLGNSGNFAIATGVAGEGTPFDTGIALNTSYNTLRIYTDGVTARKLYAQLNGGTPITVCPSGCDIERATGSNFWVTSESGIPWFWVGTDIDAARHIEVDYFSYRANAGSTEHVR